MTSVQPGIRPSTRARAIIALVALVVASAFAGAAADRAIVRGAQTNAIYDTTFHPLSSILRSPTAADRLQYREQLKRALNLSAGQDSAIDHIMSERAGEFTALREELRPRVDHLVSGVRADIERVLTDRQRNQFRALQRRGGEQLVTNGQAP
ncbi:MAG TPA: hypothetical protein VII52_09065 [Gemmatimonadaceae bacterium]